MNETITQSQIEELLEEILDFLCAQPYCITDFLSPHARYIYYKFQGEETCDEHECTMEWDDEKQKYYCENCSEKE